MGRTSLWRRKMVGAAKLGPTREGKNKPESSSSGVTYKCEGVKLVRGMSVVWYAGALGCLLYDGEEGRRTVEGREAAAGEVGFEIFDYELGGEMEKQLDSGRKGRGAMFCSWTDTMASIEGVWHDGGTWGNDGDGGAGAGRRRWEVGPGGPAKAECAGC
jgi:hypothetical protein